MLSGEIGVWDCMFFFTILPLHPGSEMQIEARDRTKPVHIELSPNEVSQVLVWV